MKTYLTLIQKFSNYKNRKLVLPDIDREEPLTVLQEEGYTYDYCRGSTGTSAIIDFNPNDGVSTSVIINWENDYEPDYLFVLDADDRHLISRWFIIEFKRTRGKQYQVQLQRDVLADNYDSIKNSPVFVQKGILSPDSPLIFNRENMTYNQIKQSEMLLKDNTNSAWIVGYVAQDAQLSASVTSEPQSLNYPDVSSIIQLNNPSDPTEGAKFKKLSGTVNVRTRYKQTDSIGYGRLDLRAAFDGNFSICTSLDGEENFGESWAFVYNKFYDIPSTLRNIYTNSLLFYKQSFKSAFESYTTTISEKMISDSAYNKIMSYNGQIVRVGTHYYKMNVSEGTTSKKYIEVEPSGTSAQLDGVLNAVVGKMHDTKPSAISSSKSGEPFYIWWYSQEYTISLEPTSLPDTYSVTLSNSHRHLDDAPYDIFALPYNEGNLRLAQEIVRKETSSKIYDVQVLPYIPVNNLLNDSGVINLALGTVNVDYNNVIATTVNKYASHPFYDWTQSQGSPDHTLCQEYFDVPEEQQNNLSIAAYQVDDYEGVVEDLSIQYNPTTQKIIVSFEVYDDVPQEVIDHINVLVKYTWVESNAVVSQLIWCTRSNRSFAISANVAPASDKKIMNETEFVRLVSPNWNGAYEFSVAKNDGIQAYNVDCTFKPYTPYIHVAPQFGGLYGTVQDARGLICNGDFSITMVNDVWKQYEVANKNYQQIFNAQIHTMDKNNQLSLGSNIATSMMGAGAAGLGAGMMTGNVFVGAGVAAASAIGGAIDIGLGQEQYKNNKQLQIDQYGYQLGNIQARPDTLNKVSTLTANNRIWPFVEFYKATDAEIEALRNKIKYNGMTVMAIGTLNDYIGRSYEGMNYFQASVIMNTEIACDNHTLDQIDIELQKGVYL